MPALEPALGQGRDGGGRVGGCGDGGGAGGVRTQVAWAPAALVTVSCRTNCGAGSSPGWRGQDAGTPGSAKEIAERAQVHRRTAYNVGGDGECIAGNSRRRRRAGLGMTKRTRLTLPLQTKVGLSHSTEQRTEVPT